MPIDHVNMSGKRNSMLRDILMHVSSNNDIMDLVVCYDYKHALSCFEDCGRMIPAKDIKSISRSQLIIKFKNGSRIVFEYKRTEGIIRLLMLEPKEIAIEELSKFSHEDFMKIQSRLRHGGTIRTT